MTAACKLYLVYGFLAISNGTLDPEI